MSFGFGAPAANANSTFNANPAANTTFGVAPTQSSFSFGAPGAAAGTSAPATGLSFGTAPAASFGAAPATSFGAAPATSFGAAPATSFGAAPATSFGAAPATSFGAAPATSFGAAPATSFGAAPAASFGTAPATSFGAAPSVSAPGLSFSLPAASTAAPALGGFGATSTLGGIGTGAKPTIAATATTASTGLTFGGLSTTKPSTGFGLATSQPTLQSTLTAPTPAAPAKIGLGGIDVNATQPKAAEGRTDSAKVKEIQLPQEIAVTVEALKVHAKNQKSISSDITRALTGKKNSNVTNELNKLNWALGEIHSNVESNYAAIKQLRAETTVAIQQAEIAQRTHDTLPGLQFENTAPILYFMDLIRKFEANMLNLKNQVELTEKHMHSLTNPQTFTADDLKKGLQQIHECFIALAGRLQETHRMVETQHEQFLNLIKHREKDKTIGNKFEGGSLFGESTGPMLQRLATSTSKIIPNVACGPTPFSSFGDFGSAQIKANASNNPENPYLSGSNAFNSTGTGGWNLGGGHSMGGGLFGSATTGGIGELQSPPVGSKRNKH